MKVAFATLGCRTNQHDTAEMQALLEQDGFSIVDPGEKADVYVINTCTVTRKSDHDSRLAVKKSLAINGNAMVVFTGCYAQMNPEESAALPGMDIVLGNANKLEIAEVIKKTLAGKNPWTKPGKADLHMSDIRGPREFRTVPVSQFRGRTKAFIKVQTGCDEKCSFCTVVLARGRSISDSRENVLRNVKEAVAVGFKEITLTGINLGTYGMDKPTRESFSSLVAEIVQLKGNFRVRISSINPMEIDDDLLRLMADTEKLCPHLHVPLQSGDDFILARMRRNYNSRQYVDMIERIARTVPNAGLGADAIVGFPGETDGMFERTRALAEGLPFSYLHAFTYSPRRSTEAHGFKDDVPKDVKKSRNKILTDLASEKSIRFRKSFVNKTVSVLVEKRRDALTGLLKGYSEQYIPVRFEGDEDCVNQIVPVAIRTADERGVYGCVPS
ncbi:MAG: tRNA (N(6)-L-threonylcarbamoyladenosine(37)-C(2))-methylthiotransferase MtaB [Nitrospinae bacterium]|nr:tRNA (N(6)-L-threonylcarbamoyladenosine(37)-C(2))-methylthiotransferase MtaB [Nitrospinota bacterium]